jgi:ribosome recycling factor
MLSGLCVKHNGKSTPLDQSVTFASPDRSTLLLTPLDNTMIQKIQKVIKRAGLGVRLGNDGETIKLHASTLDKHQKRRSLKKVRSQIGFGQLQIRALKTDCDRTLMRLVEDGLSKEDGNFARRELQECADRHIAELDEILNQRRILMKE